MLRRLSAVEHAVGTHGTDEAMAKFGETGKAVRYPSSGRPKFDGWQERIIFDRFSLSTTFSS
jgi:hypothetical protein